MNPKPDTTRAPSWLWLVLWFLCGWASTAVAEVRIEPAKWEDDTPIPHTQQVKRLFRVVNSSAQPVHVDSLSATAGLKPILTQRDLPAGATVPLVVEFTPLRPTHYDYRPYTGDVTLNLASAEQATARLEVFLMVHDETSPPPVSGLPDEVLRAKYQPARRDHPITLHYYYSGGCGSCVSFLHATILPLKAHFRDAPITWDIIDTQRPEGFATLAARRRQYDAEDSLSNLYAFVGANCLYGKDDLQTKLYPLLLAELKHPTEAPSGATDGVATMHETVRGLSFLGVLTVGMLDGVNPCALATAVFLIALLTKLGHDHRTLGLAGAAFTVGVYGTYFLLGLGVLKSLAMLGGQVKLYQLLNASIGALTLLFAAGQLRDVIRLKRGGSTRELSMQLPLKLKQQVHRLLRENLRRPSIVAGALVAGVLVTILEAICTGQVMLPTLTAVVNDPDLHQRAVLLLAVYCCGFIVPLLLILGLAYEGVTSERLAGWARAHLVPAKVALAVLLGALGAWLLAAPH